MGGRRGFDVNEVGSSLIVVLGAIFVTSFVVSATGPRGPVVVVAEASFEAVVVESVSAGDVGPLGAWSR